MEMNGVDEVGGSSEGQTGSCTGHHECSRLGHQPSPLGCFYRVKSWTYSCVTWLISFLCV